MNNNKDIPPFYKLMGKQFKFEYFGQTTSAQYVIRPVSVMNSHQETRPLIETIEPVENDEIVNK